MLLQEKLVLDPSSGIVAEFCHYLCPAQGETQVIRTKNSAAALPEGNDLILKQSLENSMPMGLSKTRKSVVESH